MPESSARAVLELGQKRIRSVGGFGRQVIGGDIGEWLGLIRVLIGRLQCLDDGILAFEVDSIGRHRRRDQVELTATADPRPAGEHAQNDGDRENYRRSAVDPAGLLLFRRRLVAFEAGDDRVHRAR